MLVCLVGGSAEVQSNPGVGVGRVLGVCSSGYPDRRAQEDGEQEDP